MTTAVTLARPGSRAVSLPSEPGAPMDFQSAYDLAQVLIKTGFLPASVKTAEQALAIMLTGQELSIPPMHALRSIHIIQGKPTLAAELQLAIFLRAGGKHQWRESTDTTAVLWLRHPNGAEHVETFTLDDARRAGLLGKDGWKNYPKAMLRARAISAGLRAVAPDIIAGIYDPEELGADVNAAGELVIPTSIVTAPTPAAEPTPVAPGAPAAPAAPAAPRPESEMTLEQAKALPLMGSAKHWGGHGGKPLGTLPRDLLEHARTWFERQAREDADAGNPLNARRAEQIEAITLVLEDLDAAQGALPLDVPDAARPVSTAQQDDAQVDVPAPGAVAAAIDPQAAPPARNGKKGEKQPLSLGALPGDPAPRRTSMDPARDMEATRR